MLDEIATGDKLRLRREDNKFDEKAILVLDEKGRKLGYIPEKDNLIFARLMDAGKQLFGRIKEKEKRGNWLPFRSESICRIELAGDIYYERTAKQTTPR